MKRFTEGLGIWVLVWLLVLVIALVVNENRRLSTRDKITLTVEATGTEDYLIQEVLDYPHKHTVTPLQLLSDFAVRHSIPITFSWEGTYLVLTSYDLIDSNDNYQWRLYINNSVAEPGDQESLFLNPGDSVRFLYSASDDS